MSPNPALDVQLGLHGAFMKDGYGVAPSVRLKSDHLAGLKLAVKDVFDVADMRMGAGNPAWLQSSSPARQTATAVRTLLEAGAEWVGKTVTDELTYSLSGSNVHYGAPRNPAAGNRLAGGSSSGSAVAVAAGYADIALGTDCGGSVRLPASYCGIWGFRPSHGRIATGGCITLAHSFDTVGWFARDWSSASRVFEVLAHTTLDGGDELPALIVPEFVQPLLDRRVREMFGQALDVLRRHVPVTGCLADAAQPFSWASAFRTLQASEAWQQHGAWIEENSASVASDVNLRFNAAATVTKDDVASSQRVRVQAMSTLNQLFEPGALMILPTVPAPAPLVNAAQAEIEQVRRNAQQMLCMAGLAGLPQVSFPWILVNGAPVGLSIIGARGADETVLAAARGIHAATARLNTEC